MSELKPCDFLGNEVFIGDEVAFFALGYRMFTRGTVVKITNKCVFIDYDNSWNYDHREEHTRQEQRQVIDLTAWNRRTQPANEPLTMEQLRNMDGEPVWVVCGIYKDWRIPEFIDEGGYKGFIKFTDRSAEPISDYGKNWLAYRRKPERSENDG